MCKCICHALLTLQIYVIVPIGFIYTQLPHQPEPPQIWPTVIWHDVSAEYDGLFSVY